MKPKKLTQSEVLKVQKRVQRILGPEFQLQRYDFDRTFSGVEFVNPHLLLIGSSTLKKLLSLNIPFNVGRLGDNRFHIILYINLKK